LLVLLAPAGTLMAHGLAYWSQGDETGLHAYLGLLGLPAVAAIGVVWAIAAQPGRRTPLPSVRALAVAQVSVFAVGEAVERAAHHVALGDLASELAASDAVRVGLVLQLVVAVGLLTTVRGARVVVERATSVKWTLSGPWWFDRPSVELCPVPIVVVERPRTQGISSRGPPVGFVR
jgi:hypothetical protein